MAERVSAGTWVEIHSVVLAPEERADHLPEDTRRVPLEMRVKGFLVAAAALGERVEIVTVAGPTIGSEALTEPPPPWPVLKHRPTSV